MTTTDRLALIRARCVELLDLASKRTPGKWESKPLKYGYHIIPAEAYCDRSAKQTESEQQSNAAYIAACAGAAEAGWKDDDCRHRRHQRRMPALLLRWQMPVGQANSAQDDDNPRSMGWAGMKLPPHLFSALKWICAQSGEQINYALGHLNQSTARSYVSKLKTKGLAYTYKGEVWPTAAGQKLIRESTK